MKILILTPFLPYPLDQGGKIRIFNIIKNLGASHSITLAALVDNAAATDIGPLKDLCAEVLLFERPARLWPDRFAFFTSSSPYNVIRYSCPDMRRRLKQLHQANKFDLVQIEFAMMWQYASLFPSTPVVLDAHNIEYKNVQQIGNSATSLLWKLLYKMEKKRLQAVEESAWRECRLCFTVSDDERKEIAAISGDSAKVITAANGVDPERFVFQPRRKNGRKILFLGGMDYTPNLDAARYFLKEVFPLIRAEEPEARVLLIGRELGKLFEAAVMPGVECHESVPEVLPWFYEADLLVVPLRQGAGTRIKVLEAMSAGLPVVATPKGCEGISVTNGREILIAPTSNEFSSACLMLLRDSSVGERLAQKARQLVLARYTWRKTAAVISDSYLTL